MIIYEAIWIVEDANGEIVDMGTFLAETRYLAKHYCGAPDGAKVAIRKRRVMMNI